jgi:hypothetical protein
MTSRIMYEFPRPCKTSTPPPNTSWILGFLYGIRHKFTPHMKCEQIDNHDVRCFMSKWSARRMWVEIAPCAWLIFMVRIIDVGVNDQLVLGATCPCTPKWTMLTTQLRSMSKPSKNKGKGTSTQSTHGNKCGYVWFFFPLVIYVQRLRKTKQEL